MSAIIIIIYIGEEVIAVEGAGIAAKWGTA